MSFDPFDLLPSSKAALARMQITSPTPIQQAIIPLLLEGRDVLGQARTGSGKTLAFALPMMEFLDPGQSFVQALILAPTRELATQVAGIVDELGRADGIKTVEVFGGRSINPQIAQLKGAHVVVGAPGRVLDLARRGALKLDRVEYVVLDEADEMLDQGFAPDVERILAMLPKERQTALFSATMPDAVLRTSQKHLYRPERVVVDSPEAPSNIRQLAYWIPADQRLEVLKSLLDQRDKGSTIVFGRTKHGVRKLGKLLDRLGYSVGCLQGNLSQNARDRVMADFREGRTQILVATNVAARGLDVDHVQLVINYELPESSELLTHRVGRTGRMERAGTAITLLTESESAKWRSLQRGLGRKIESVTWSR